MQTIGRKTVGVQARMPGSVPIDRARQRSGETWGADALAYRQRFLVEKNACAYKGLVDHVAIQIGIIARLSAVCAPLAAGAIHGSVRR